MGTDRHFKWWGGADRRPQNTPFPEFGLICWWSNLMKPTKNLELDPCYHAWAIADIFSGGVGLPEPPNYPPPRITLDELVE